MKKKIFLGILIVLVIIIIVFTIDLFRKAFIINEYSTKLNEYQKATNYYAKFKINGNTQELWRKDDIGITKYTDNNTTRIMYVNSENIWVFLEDGKKTAHKSKNENSGAFLPVIEDATFYSHDFGQSLSTALKSKISTENINEKKCFKIYINDDFQIFVNNDDYIKVKEINSGTTKELLEYSFNTVTDNDVLLPDLNQYEIVE